MPKFKIEFKHTVEITYHAFVEAKTKKEAEDIFDSDPFSYVENMNGEEEQGLY